MSFPKPGDSDYEESIERMRRELALQETYAPVIKAARHIILERGGNFEEEFAKYRKEEQHGKRVRSLVNRR